MVEQGALFESKRCSADNAWKQKNVGGINERVRQENERGAESTGKYF